jgi:D-3-phosphoglycerate dehydrogenase / 2-oxoglutarate reductase
MTTNKKHVFVVDTTSPSVTAMLEAKGDVVVHRFSNFVTAADFQKQLAAAPQVNAAILGATPFGAAEIASSKGLMVVARVGVGYDAVDVPALTRIKVPLMTTGIANSPSVAEQAVFFMMQLSKRAAELDALVKEGRWQQRMQALPIDLLGKSVLIAGFGRIGTRTAKRCLAMEMNVLVYDPYVKADAIKAAGCEPVTDLDAALPRADIFTLHCPKTPETTGMINAARLARMKPTAFLINTARGGIVDEAALHAALVAKKLAGAGLDVFEKEPPPADHPLFKLGNVITAPHVAGVTRESVERMGQQAARNVLSVFDGAPIVENVINKDVLG